jgi:hypothetical protein
MANSFNFTLTPITSACQQQQLIVILAAIVIIILLKEKSTVLNQEKRDDSGLELPIRTTAQRLSKMFFILMSSNFRERYL